MNTSSDRMIGGLFHVIRYLNSDWWRVLTRFRRFDTYFDPSKSVETFRLLAVLVSTFDISHFYFRQATIVCVNFFSQIKNNNDNNFLQISTNKANE